MRILHLVTRRQRRGAEVFATELADALVARGHTVLVAGLYEPADNPLTPERARWVDVDASSGSRLHPGTLVRLDRAIRSFGPDVVQANGSDTLKYSVLARLLGYGDWPLVYRNISVASRWLRGPLHRRWNAWLVKHVDQVVAVSRPSGEDFIATYGFEPRRLVVIPRSVRVPDRFAPDESRRTIGSLTGVPPNAPLLMHIGSFSPEKNHLWLVDVFHEIRRQRPTVHLVFVGDGPLRERVEERVRARGLGECVHLLGTRSDASELVGAADILVLPSLIEGLPGVVLEAAVRGIPSIATDVGGVHQAVRHGETGLLVPPNDPAAFVSAVSLMLDHPRRRVAMGARARDMVARDFEFEQTVDRYEALYTKLMDGRAESVPFASST